MRNRLKDALIISSYVLIGILTRTVWHVAPNVEFVTALSLAGGFFLRRKRSLAIPVGIMVLSDFLIGNTPIFLFTWSAFAVAGIIGRLMNSEWIQKRMKALPANIRLFIGAETGAIFFTLFFFLWTNFGVVVVSNLYPKTISGLLQSYSMGIPFFIPQIIGNIVITPLIFGITKLFYSKNVVIFPKLQHSVNQ